MCKYIGLAQRADSCHVALLVDGNCECTYSEYHWYRCTEILVMSVSAIFRSLKET